MSTLLNSRRLILLVFLCVLGALLAQAQPVLAASCIVTSTADSGAGTLRQCLLGAGPGDVITFDPTVFPPGAPATINLTAPLPVMAAGGVTIDAANAGVKVDGDGIGQENADGIVLASSNNALYGLHLHAFHGRGIVVQAGANDNRIGGALPGQRNIVDRSGNGAIYILGNGNQVSGNWIGTEDGVTLPGPAGNAGSGVELAAGAQRNIIGGDQPGQGNVIVGSLGNGVAIYGTGATSNTVAGNHIGLNAAGTAALGNAGNGVRIEDGASANLVGGNASSGAANHIAGNNNNGVEISGAGTNSNQVFGNFIGMASDGVTAIGNGGRGVLVEDGPQDTVIGNGAATRNIISANQRAGIRIQGSGTDRTIVRGNFIGVDVTGTQARGNGNEGIWVSDGANYTVIGGAGTGEGNVLSANTEEGIYIHARVLFTVIRGNRIGVDAQGLLPLGNGKDGIELHDGPSFTQIGGVNATPGVACTGACNVIGASTHHGIVLGGESTISNTISGNYVGVGANGIAVIGNGNAGVAFRLGANHNWLGGVAAGAGNVIANNPDAGVQVNDATTLANTLTRNQVYSNTQTGIDLANGGNAELAAPVVITATNSGMVVGTACANCTVEVFSDAAGQGRVFEGSAVANGAGQFTFQATSLLTGPQLTATATDASGNTSEFSAPLALPTQALRVYLPVVRK